MHYSLIIKESNQSIRFFLYLTNLLNLFKGNAKLSEYIARYIHDETGLLQQKKKLALRPPVFHYYPTLHQYTLNTCAFVIFQEPIIRTI